MIKSIELRNWKTHRHTVMNFQKGVNVLVGVMGAGKSSVIDGISFGLFGTFPSLIHKRTTISSLISNRPTVESEAEVKVRFSVGDDEYAVTRKISRTGGTSAKLEKNGTYLQTQPARVNEEIGSLIKTDYDTFSRAIYAEQNRLDYFLELPKGDRKRQIDQMLGLDNFARAEENSTSLLNSIKSAIAEDERQLEQYDIPESKSQLEVLVKERQQIESDQEAFKAELKALESKKGELSKHLEEMKSRSELKKRLEKETESLSGRISVLQSELKKIADTEGTMEEAKGRMFALSGKLAETDKELKQQRADESSSIKRLAEAELQASLAKKKMAERDRVLESLKGANAESLETEVDAADSRIRESINHISAIKATSAEAGKWLKELEKHVGKCPICDSVLEEQKRQSLISQRSQSIKESAQKMAELETSKSKLELELQSMRKKLESVKSAASKLLDYKDADKQLSDNSSIAEKEKSGLESLKLKIDLLSKEAERLNREIGEAKTGIDMISRREKYKEEIARHSRELDSKIEESKSVEFDEKMLYELHERITETSSRYSEISSKHEGNLKYVKSIDMQIESKIKEIAAYDAIKGRIEVKGAHVQSVSKFRMALLDTETQLRNSLVNSINMLMREIWPQLYPYADYSAVRLDARKDDYCLEAGTGIDSAGKTEWSEIDGMASGGERSTACLTMRIALAMVIVPNLRWLILDEPTHNIDERGISRFIEVLANTLPNVVEQIFIITHDGALKNISSARIYSLERNKDRNEHTSVAES